VVFFFITSSTIASFLPAYALRKKNYNYKTLIVAITRKSERAQDYEIKVVMCRNKQQPARKNLHKIDIFMSHLIELLCRHISYEIGCTYV